MAATAACRSMEEDGVLLALRRSLPAAAKGSGMRSWRSWRARGSGAHVLPERGGAGGVPAAVEDKNLRVTVSVCDVSVRAEREKPADTVKQALGGKLDILVNNAGSPW
ncbi:hypothetical protein ZWY2020_055380 [Hordeum vulgare]|nr:hypothetical protein ZWY2020_055380 [Hordeum vulgare]